VGCCSSCLTLLRAGNTRWLLGRHKHACMRVCSKSEETVAPKWTACERDGAGRSPRCLPPAAALLSPAATLLSLLAALLPSTTYIIQPSPTRLTCRTYSASAPPLPPLVPWRSVKVASRSCTGSPGLVWVALPVCEARDSARSTGASPTAWGTHRDDTPQGVGADVWRFEQRRQTLEACRH
jgi:hypothetical protein